MSLADAKFPQEIPESGPSAIPPSPTRENPGQVYPKSDPSPAPRHTPQGLDGPHQTGNPFVMKGALDKLHRSLSDVINVIEGEESTEGGTQGEDALLTKFKTWRTELEAIASGNVKLSAEHADTVRPEGPMFTD
ncbi:hypothetical protein BD626DRAFT_548184 [Schizophyllum amplum]|uniref:Uncharacterized protein n=1 Tax=Schizophyllum amplum TaxID=97359 RepID=A0A550CEQ8_9AGAR|nr:hypothetical protein BD626DRAFT_548184 [Auriculariopsis ampla]